MDQFIQSVFLVLKQINKIKADLHARIESHREHRDEHVRQSQRHDEIVRYDTQLSMPHHRHHHQQVTEHSHDDDRAEDAALEHGQGHALRLIVQVEGLVLRRRIRRHERHRGQRRNVRGFGARRHRRPTTSSSCS